MKNLKIYKINNNFTLNKMNNFKKIIMITILSCVINNCSEEITNYINYKSDLEFLRKQNKQTTYETNVTVSTINTHNIYYDDQRTNKNSLSKKLIIEGTDIIGTQETIRSDIKELNEITNKHDYNITGNYRWGNKILGQLLEITNESNNIIAKNNIYMEKTLVLPWLPKNKKELTKSIQCKSLIPRILTHCVTKIDKKYIHVYNTHLDFGVESIQKRQMDTILDEIDKNNNLIKLPVVIMGDFNAIKNSYNMNYFTQELNKRNIKMIENTEVTCGNNVIDYIFVSNEFQIKKYFVIPNNQSDHDSLYATLKLK